jgi:hypothetical protein
VDALSDIEGRIHEEALPLMRKQSRRPKLQVSSELKQWVQETFKNPGYLKLLIDAK